LAYIINRDGLKNIINREENIWLYKLHVTPCGVTEEDRTDNHWKSQQCSVCERESRVRGRVCLCWKLHPWLSSPLRILQCHIKYLNICMKY